MHEFFLCVSESFFEEIKTEEKFPRSQCEKLVIQKIHLVFCLLCSLLQIFVVYRGNFVGERAVRVCALMFCGGGCVINSMSNS